MKEAPLKTTTRKKAIRRKQKAPGKLKIIDHPKASELEFTNREIGWLNFNRRVLSEAEDARNPLLERVRFLSICSSNLDEFFMKRVGGLKRQVAYGVSAKSSDGKTPEQQLVEIRKSVTPMLLEQTKLFSKTLMPALKQAGVFLLKWKELSNPEKEIAKKYYLKNVFPVLTPLSVDQGHPFPFISNLSVSLGITLRPPNGEEKLFARVKVPQVLPQWVKVNQDEKIHRYISLVDLIKENLSDLFPHMQVLDVMSFRLTRNADMTRDEEDAEDLLRMIEEELKMRRFAEVVRLEHGPNPDQWMLKFLQEELDLHSEDIYEFSDEIDYANLGQIADLNIKDLRFEGWKPITPPQFSDESPGKIFDLIRQQDHLVHPPFDNFSNTVERFIRQASEDPQVLAIKMTLYRTGDNSPFIRSLIRAAESGKQVVCLVELKARFDEERNIYWAQALENAGVHVVYGIVGLKTHAKTALVVRNDADGIRCYAHIGTGNYNVATSRFYTDLGLLTAREEITSELVEFFHYLTGRSLKSDYQNILVAPINMFSKFKFMIDREVENHRKGLPSGIIVKMNNMEENSIALALYAASSQGVDISMIVRGFCCIRPGVPGLSEKIKVISVIGRFLEHSRVFYFRNGAKNPVDGDFFIGSADWMYRNLHARVECVVPIIDRTLKERLWDILSHYLADQRQTWDMKPDGSYLQRKSTAQDKGIHHHFMQKTLQRSKEFEDSQAKEREHELESEFGKEIPKRKPEGR